MAKEAYWFKHDLNSRNDKKLIKLRMEMGMEGVGLYWCIVEMLYEEGGYLMRTEYERIAFEMQSQCERIAKIVETHSLFKMDHQKFWSDSIIRRLNARAGKSQKARDAANILWEQKRNANASETHSESMPRREDNKKENKKEVIFGISFSEDMKSVKMNDGTIQELDLDQLRLVKEGNYQPHYVKKKLN
jgi:hypothetical protein